MKTVYVALPTAIERISSIHHQACIELASAVRDKDSNMTAALTAGVTVLRAALEALTNGRTQITGDRPMRYAIEKAVWAAAEFADSWVGDDAIDTARCVAAALTRV